MKGRHAAIAVGVTALIAAVVVHNHNQLHKTSETTSGPTTYYVATTGLDTNACTLAAPCLTLSHVTLLTHPGDTVIVQAGTYGPQYIQGTGGTATAPLTVTTQGTV